MDVFLYVDWNQCKAGSIINVEQVIGYDIINRKIGIEYNPTEPIFWCSNINLSILENELQREGKDRKKNSIRKGFRQG